MGQQERKSKYINRLHLIYPAILAISAMVFIVSMDHGASRKAGDTLAFAATLASIILSVIAIIMTIVDAAGQRNIVADLEETAEQLKESLVKVNAGISEINNLKDQLLNTMDNINKSNASVQEEIVELKQKYSKPDGNNADEVNINILNDLNKLSQKIEKLQLQPTSEEISIQYILTVEVPDYHFKQRHLKDFISDTQSCLNTLLISHDLKDKQLILKIYSRITNNMLEELRTKVLEKYGCKLVRISTNDIFF